MEEWGKREKSVCERGREGERERGREGEKERLRSACVWFVLQCWTLGRLCERE